MSNNKLPPQPTSEAPRQQPIDYKNPDGLRRYISPRGRIAPGRISSVSAKKQRMITRAIKRARFLALLPYLDR